VHHSPNPPFEPRHVLSSINPLGPSLLGPESRVNKIASQSKGATARDGEYHSVLRESCTGSLTGLLQDKSQLPYSRVCMSCTRAFQER